MIVVGITGKIAAGKSTIAHFFKEKNFPVFDADFEARKLQETAAQIQRKIQKKFPNVFDKKGKLDRQKLRFEVLKNDSSLRDMEEIIFPEVKKKAINFISQNKYSPFIVLDVPLMWGSGIDILCDEIFYIETSETCRHKRISERGFLSLEELRRIEKRQKQEENNLTDKVLVLRGDISLLETKLLLDSYLRKKGLIR
ncbi:dephospho-CoA kinase [Acetobacteraceae bacterium]|nr:dephospho-CoA kinase [Acetobacteraceae bacterium]